MLSADRTDIPVFPRRIKTALLLFALAAGLGGCVEHMPAARKGKETKPASSVNRSKADKAVDAAESGSDKSAPEITGENRADYSCSYFQFLRT